MCSLIKQSADNDYFSLSGLMSPTLAPTAAAAPALAPAMALAPAPVPVPVQNDLLESGFDNLGSLPSPAAPVPAAAAAAPIVPAATDSVPAAQAPPGGFNASSKKISISCLINDREVLGNVLFMFAQVF